jgi:hypothetical protein
MTDFNLSPSKILWPRVLSLAALQAGISLAWVVYALYIPQLLKQVGLPASAAVPLLIVENGLSVVMEPLMGGLSDRARRRMGTQLPFIAAGVIVSALLLASLPLLAGMGDRSDQVARLLTWAVITWSLAMTIFRSPALALLGQTAMSQQLPQAASLLTFAGAIAGALGVFAQSAILGLGAIATFAISSGVLLLACGILWVMHRQPPNAPHSDSQPRTEPLQAEFSGGQPFDSPQRAATPATGNRRPWGWIFAVGVGVGLGFALLRQGLLNPKALTDAGALLPTFTVAHLLTVLPAGAIATAVGTQRTLMVGLGSTAGLMGLMAIGVGNGWSGLGTVGAVGLGLAWSGVSTCTIPYALLAAPPQRAGLAMGLFFGGIALASSLVGNWINQAGTLPIVLSVGVAMVGFLAAALAVAKTPTAK